jgi:glycosyltransferase involved in cell wall biosynthesis
MQLSIVIPLHNEEGSVASLRDEVIRSLACQEGEWEIIFVNDGSSDRTGQLLDETARDNPRCKVIHLKRNFGQTVALMAGIDHASGDIIVTMDGDLQNDPADIPRLIAKLAEGFDVCSGWRNKRRDHRFFRILPSRIANAFISRILGVPLHDYGCTLKAYRREVVKSVKLYGEMHRFIPVYSFWQGARVTEIPVAHRPRLHGKSHYGFMRVFKVLLDLIVVKFLAGFAQKPIYVFGGFGMLSFLLSVFCFGLMVYFKYWGGKTFVQTPLPQLVVLFILVGFVSVLMGLLAEIQMRTYYESQDKPVYLVRQTRNMGNNT